MRAFFDFDTPYEHASSVLLGAPFDSTTSFRPGARFASAAMRAESYGLETYSPYRDQDLADRRICDLGDMELSIGDPSRALDQIAERVGHILRDGKLPVMIGGEHLVTLGAVRAVAQKYPDLHVVHLDAHADFRDEYLGARLSHATVMRRVWDMMGDQRIFQFGIRSGAREEFAFAAAHAHTRKFDFKGLADVCARLGNSPTYLTIDLDVLDTSVFPGTGTPEPGGVAFAELLGALDVLCDLNIVGCDMTELCPVYDQSGASTAVALKILRELLLALT